jgi:hypothetical protein
VLVPEVLDVLQHRLDRQVTVRLRLPWPLPAWPMASAWSPWQVPVVSRLTGALVGGGSDFGLALTYFPADHGCGAEGCTIDAIMRTDDVPPAMTRCRPGSSANTSGRAPRSRARQRFRRRRRFGGA